MYKRWNQKIDWLDTLVQLNVALHTLMMYYSDTWLYGDFPPAMWNMHAPRQGPTTLRRDGAAGWTKPSAAAIHLQTCDLRVNRQLQNWDVGNTGTWMYDWTEKWNSVADPSYIGGAYGFEVATLGVTYDYNKHGWLARSSRYGWTSWTIGSDFSSAKYPPLRGQLLRPPRRAAVACQVRLPSPEYDIEAAALRCRHHAGEVRLGRFAVVDNKQVPCQVRLQRRWTYSRGWSCIRRSRTCSTASHRRRHPSYILILFTHFNNVLLNANI